MHKKTYTTVVSRGKITSYLNFTFCNVIHFRHYYLHIIRRKQIGSKLEQQKRPSETDEVWPLQQLCSTKVSIYRQWNGTHSLRRARGHGCVCMSLPPCTAAVCGRPSGHLLPRLHGQLGMASSKTCSYRDTPHRSPPTPRQAGSLLLQQRTWGNPSSGKPSVTQTGSDWMPWVPAYTPSSQKNTAAQPSPTSSCCSCLPVFVLAGIKQLWLTSFTWTTYRLYLITIWHNNEHAYR